MRRVSEFLEINLIIRFFSSRIHLLSPQSDHLLHVEPQLAAPVHIMFAMQSHWVYAEIPACELGYSTQFQRHGSTVINK